MEYVDSCRISASTVGSSGNVVRQSYVHWAYFEQGLGVRCPNQGKLSGAHASTAPSPKPTWNPIPDPVQEEVSLHRAFLQQVEFPDLKSRSLRVSGSG